MRRLAPLLLAAIVLPAFAAAPFITGMSCRFQDRDLLVSFTLGGSFDRDDLKEAIMSTRPVNITFTVELLKHRTMWPPKTVARRKLVRTIHYDNLTRQFTVESSVEGEVVDQKILETWDEMACACSEVKDLKVTSVANMDPADTYSIRAQVHVLNDFALWIIPWDVQTPWSGQKLATP